MELDYQLCTVAQDARENLQERQHIAAMIAESIKWISPTRLLRHLRRQGFTVAGAPGSRPGRRTRHRLAFDPKIARIAQVIGDVGDER